MENVERICRLDVKVEESCHRNAWQRLVKERNDGKEGHL